jgi:D-alanyl-D-alanine dipeptidase
VQAVELNIPKNCRQLVLVTTTGWNASEATLRRFTRTHENAAWEKVGTPVPVLLGEHGLAWGLGRHAIPEDGAPRKVEGDRRAPAGIFPLGEAFGTRPRASLPGLKLPYRLLTPTLEGVDDPASRHYNQIVDRARIARPDWRSSEQMAAIPAYRLGVVVAHNAQRQPGAGSCIFLHLRMSGTRGTAGCTALREADLTALVCWLDPAQQPLLMQMPQEVARRLAGVF